MRRPRLFLALLFASALFVLACRVAYTVAKSEVGRELLAWQAYDALFAWTGIRSEPIDMREPSEQANYLIAEVDQIVCANPDRADLAMGAAWILDSPGVRFMQRYIRPTRNSGAFPAFGVGLDQDALKQANEEFERNCREKCLELATRATELAPQEVNWWRMRALLQFDEGFHPRRSDWLDVLDECARHDPGNALYDYLAAYVLWSQAGEYDLKAPDYERYELRVLEFGDFAAGIDRFDRGQQRPFLAIGEHGLASVPEFLARSQVRRIDQADLAVSRRLTIRQAILVFGLWRWQQVRADDAREQSNAAAEAVIRRQELRLFEQAIAPKETSALATLSKHDRLRRISYDELRAVARDNPDLVSPAELAQLAVREKERRIKSKSLVAALTEMAEARGEQSQRGLLLAAAVNAVALVSPTWLLLIAAVLLLLRWLLGSALANEQREFGVVRHTLAWLAGYGLTFLILGIAPAEVISRQNQQRALDVFVYGSAAAMLAWSGWLAFRSFKRRGFQFRLVSLFGLTLGCALLVSLWPILRGVLFSAESYPPEQWLPARGAGQIDAEPLRLAAGMAKGSWNWAVYQWLAHGGVYAGFIVSLCLVAVWFTMRQSRTERIPFVEYWTRNWRQRWAALFSCIARSAGAAAACFLLAYLAAAPEVIRRVEAEYQYKIGYCRDVAAHWNAIAHAQAAVEQKRRQQYAAEVESEMQDAK